MARPSRVEPMPGPKQSSSRLHGPQSCLSSASALRWIQTPLRAASAGPASVLPCCGRPPVLQSSSPPVRQSAMHHPPLPRRAPPRPRARLCPSLSFRRCARDGCPGRPSQGPTWNRRPRLLRGGGGGTFGAAAPLATPGAHWYPPASLAAAASPAKTPSTRKQSRRSSKLLFMHRTRVVPLGSVIEGS